MRKALLITIVFLLLTLSITQSAIAQRQNIITNQTTEPLYVVYSTKFGAHGAIPAGYWTAGWKEISAGQQEAFGRMIRIRYISKYGKGANALNR